MRRQGKVGTPNESGRAASNALPSKARSRAGLNWWRFMRTAPEEGSPKRLQRSKSMFQRQSRVKGLRFRKQSTDNDPSAGSPTETLLRLLLSPSDRV